MYVKLVKGVSYSFKRSPGMKSFTSMHNIFSGLAAGFEATFIVSKYWKFSKYVYMIGSNKRLEVCIWLKISDKLINIRISISSSEKEGNNKFRLSF